MDVLVIFSQYLGDYLRILSVLSTTLVTHFRIISYKGCLVSTFERC